MNNPIYKGIFGESWDKLPDVMKQHYAHRPYSDDLCVAEGMMTIESSPLIRILKPLFRLMGTLVPYEGVDIPVTVHYRSMPQSEGYILDRIFYFPGRKPYQYRSTMYAVQGREMAEVMRAGLCWRTLIGWRNEKISMEHNGFGFRIFGKIIPFPIDFLFGKVYAEEIPLSDDHFSIMMDIQHPWSGKLYGYHGTFKITQKCKKENNGR